MQRSFRVAACLFRLQTERRPILVWSGFGIAHFCVLLRLKVEEQRRAGFFHLLFSRCQSQLRHKLVFFVTIWCDCALFHATNNVGVKATWLKGRIRKMKLDKELRLFHNKRGHQREMGNSNIRRSFRATYFIFSLHAENGDDFVVDLRPVAYLQNFYSKLERQKGEWDLLPSSHLAAEPSFSVLC